MHGYYSVLKFIVNMYILYEWIGSFHSAKIIHDIVCIFEMLIAFQGWSRFNYDKKNALRIDLLIIQLMIMLHFNCLFNILCI